MRLNLDEIKAVTVGAVKIVCEDSGKIRFCKCTDKQIAAYDAISETLGMRSRTTTGIRLDFHTDSRTLKFKAPSGGKFDLLIDGILRKRFTSTPGEPTVEESVSLCDVLGNAAESVRVTLAFPSHNIGTLEYVELDDGATVTPHKYGKKILFIGDSITQGHNSYFDTLSYAWRVTNHFDADSVINGIGGAYFAIETFDKPDYDPDIVVVAYGTNDWGHYRDPEEMFRHVRGYLDLIKEAYGDKKVFVLSPIWRADANGNVMGPLFDERRKRIEREAAERGFIAVDGLSLVPPMKEFFADTYLHPNDLGFSMFAQNLIETMEKHL